MTKKRLNRAVFLDRDGVVNAMVEQADGSYDSPYSCAEFELLSGSGEGVRIINELGLLAIVVSNQPGIAKGKCTPQVLAAITEKMLAELAMQEAHIDPDKIFYCMHHPEAIIEDYRVLCDCRKPKPGLLLRAAQHFNIDLGKSYMVGDSQKDIQAGQAVGCKTILVHNHLFEREEQLNPGPDFIAANLLEAARQIQQWEGQNANLH